jgi:hypothetical protein
MRRQQAVQQQNAQAQDQQRQDIMSRNMMEFGGMVRDMGFVEAAKRAEVLDQERPEGFDVPRDFLENIFTEDLRRQNVSDEAIAQQQRRIALEQTRGREQRRTDRTRAELDRGTAMQGAMLGAMTQPSTSTLRDRSMAEQAGRRDLEDTKHTNAMTFLNRQGEIYGGGAQGQGQGQGQPTQDQPEMDGLKNVQYMERVLGYKFSPDMTDQHRAAVRQMLEARRDKLDKAVQEGRVSVDVATQVLQNMIEVLRARGAI